MLSAYRGKNYGFVLPSNQPLHIFECPIEIQPHEFAALLGSPEEFSRIPDRLFEELVADLLEADGWNVELVARNNAPGPDIIATTSKTISGIPQKMIVECKRHKTNRPVDINVVRKVMYWVNDEYRSTLGMIATTSGFTRQATLEATERHPWRLKLVDQYAISEWVRQAFQGSNKV
ncbi:MAG: restriction endonuclease [Proteobacteria bacterium]|nr:restriction endonuclease [Pseudomonadota bacterium]